MTVLPGSPPVEITLRRSARARRISLRVSRLDGRVTLTLPQRMREAEAMAFARAQEDWIRQALAAMPEQRLVALGQVIPVEGQALEIRSLPRGAPRIDGDSLLIPGDPARVGARVAGFLKVLARDRLQTACDRHSGALGRPYGRMSLLDTRSRWGSCSSSGTLMFSWRLVMAPPEILDYVAAHEVAHLAEMNHSPAFWAVVARLCPDYARHRRWLRQQGQDLHGWVFSGQGE